MTAIGQLKLLTANLFCVIISLKITEDIGNERIMRFIMRNINICADGGGTSLRLTAFSDNLKLAAQSKSGSVNPNFETNERIGENMAEAVKLLIAELDCEFIINNIYVTIVGSADYFKDILTREMSGRIAENAAFNIISETHSHILAASLGYTGGIALAGTGSGAIYCKNRGT